MSLKNHLGSLLTRTHKSSSNKWTRRNQRFIAFEALENRNLLAVNVVEVEVVKADFDGDGTVDAVSTTTNSYNSRGDLLESILKDDFDADGTTDEVESTTSSYDPRGNLLESVFKVDSDGDGTANRVESITDSYDRQGNLVERVFEIEDDADGTADNVIIFTAFYSYSREKV